MRSKIHPPYYSDAQIVCSCGNAFTTGSTKKLIKIELCSHCHPFYTGKQKFVDSEGRIKKFQRRQKQAETVKLAVKQKKAKQKKKTEQRPLTLKEMLMGK